MNTGAAFLIAFAFLVAVWTFFARNKEMNEYQNKIEPVLKREKFELYDFSRPEKIGYMICAVFGVVSAIIGIVQKNYTTTAIGIVIAGVFAGEWRLTDKRYRLYYNSECFVAGNDRVEYRSIKDIREIRHLPFAWKKVITYSGKEVRVSPKSIEIIEEKRNDYRNRKKK